MSPVMKLGVSLDVSTLLFWILEGKLLFLRPQS